MISHGYIPASVLPRKPVRCPSCKRGDAIVRNGTRDSGVQRYLCKHCRRNFTEAAASPFGRLQGHPIDILLAAHSILVDRVPVQTVADEHEVAWATAKKWADYVEASPGLLVDAKKLAEGLRSDVEALVELVEVADLLGLLEPGEASQLRTSDAMSPNERRRRLGEVSAILRTARETRDLMAEIKSALQKKARRTGRRL